MSGTNTPAYVQAGLQLCPGSWSSGAHNKLQEQKLLVDSSCNETICVNFYSPFDLGVLVIYSTTQIIFQSEDYE